MRAYKPRFLLNAQLNSSSFGIATYLRFLLDAQLQRHFGKSRAGFLPLSFSIFVTAMMRYWLDGALYGQIGFDTFWSR